VDKGEMLQVEEERKRAEMDKIAAQSVLEERSKEYVLEVEKRSELEAMITDMEEKLLKGHQLQTGIPDIQTAIQETETRMRTEYQAKMTELERDRAMIVMGKGQVDKYKELLLKQRDVMISLTASLNKRDETILAFQEEVDAFDHHQREMEDLLDIKTGEVLHLEKQLLEDGIPLPVEDPLEMRQLIKSRLIYPPHTEEGGVGLKALASQRDDMRDKLTTIRKEKENLDYLLRERLETMVETEIEERIAKICTVTQSKDAMSSKTGFLELASLRSDTPEFQQRLTSLVKKEAQRKGTGESKEESQRKVLKDALKVKGIVMTSVCDQGKDSNSNQRLLQKMMATDQDSLTRSSRNQALAPSTQTNSRLEADKVISGMKREHAERCTEMRAETQEKEKSIQAALEKNRRAMVAPIGTHHRSQNDVEHNLELIEKETLMISRSYEEKVNSIVNLFVRRNGTLTQSLFGR